MSGSITATEARLPRSLTKKKIDVTFWVASGGFGNDTTSDTATLSGYRCRVDVVDAGMRSGSSLQLTIEGVPLAMMNRMSVLTGRVNADDQNAYPVTQNRVLVQAGDDQRGMSTVFYGNVSEAFADFAGAPNVAFHITAYGNIALGTDVAFPISSKGPVKASSVYSQIAAAAGLTLIDHGVTNVLQSHYFCGTLAQQLDKVSTATRTVYRTHMVGPDNASGVLEVWPRASKGTTRSGVVLVSKATGLIGYPAYSQTGVQFSTLFNPNIAFWGPVQLQSDYTPAAWTDNRNGQIGKMPSDGSWIVSRIAHNLASELPGGPWMTIVEAIRIHAASSIRVA